MLPTHWDVMETAQAQGTHHLHPEAAGAECGFLLLLARLELRCYVESEGNEACHHFEDEN